MPFKDLSALPQGQTEGVLPDPQPYFAPVLAQAWADTLDDGSKDMAFPEARIRHSQAAGCARAIGYAVAGTPKTEPPDIAARWVMGLGTMVHELWQEQLAKLYPDAEIEKKVWIDKCKSAGHIDAVVGDKTLELKSINGFGAKMAVGARGPAEGPRLSALTQLALNAHAANAQEARLVLVFMENMSPREAIKLGPEPWRRFCAEWTFTRDQFEPIADAEINRFVKILALVDEGKLPPRAIPGTPPGARIVDVDKGAWQVTSANGDILDAGTTWHCNGYCDWQSQCRKDGM